ncbi:uncharacterized protein BDR25DRAFT_355527 [Lindgomyces ingoldianus]|uniref:Uncharacterized protein n=1 Tax=Lindgomyces ingoldianus TaxID=673940 RepID=A0ACB6QW53_9PLEO|nr:uncharacterized protein BDR25DRAFT_355527 [Lindgomyces ingoldianus]KAF2470421.1 hypothetical protein BDR25DRAFT_355527 [Lindgomyces ingoldianus]
MEDPFSSGNNCAKLTKNSYLAEHVKLPLYSVTSRDLGTTAGTELVLKDIFEITGRWNCSKLVRYCQYLLQERQFSDIEQHILLYALGYFNEILLLTSNRLALHHPPLDEPFRLRFWENFLEIVNRRQIRNVAVTEHKLVLDNDEELGLEHIKQAVVPEQDFENYLRKLHGHSNEDWAQQEGLVSIASSKIAATSFFYLSNMSSAVTYHTLLVTSLLKIFRYRFYTPSVFPPFSLSVTPSVLLEALLIPASSYITTALQQTVDNKYLKNTHKLSLEGMNKVLAKITVPRLMCRRCKLPTNPPHQNICHRLFWSRQWPRVNIIPSAKRYDTYSKIGCQKTSLEKEAAVDKPNIQLVSMIFTIAASAMMNSAIVTKALPTLENDGPYNFPLRWVNRLDISGYTNVRKGVTAGDPSARKNASTGLRVESRAVSTITEPFGGCIVQLRKSRLLLTNCTEEMTLVYGLDTVTEVL